MTEFLVQWKIDIDAKTPKKAAMEAQKIQRDPESTATFFEVTNKETQEEVKKCIKDCEGKHEQQVAYSSYHDALTQICFGCDKVRTNLKWKK